MSDIEWTDATWNPLVGCSRVSPGCEHCYAERFVHRGLAEQHRGLTVLGKGDKGPRWTGEVRLVESALAKPFSWKKPRRVFVNSLSDLWHENVPNETVAAIFGVMAACPHLTFQVLTKRPERMRAWFGWIARKQAFAASGTEAQFCRYQASCHMREDVTAWERVTAPWPLDNVEIGVTTEDQQRADERIPHLVQTPAARRFVSYEPGIGPVRFDRIGDDEMGATYDALRGCMSGDHEHSGGPRLDWVIVGGESGPGARTFDLAWARSAVEQCRAAGVPVFYKQGGASNRCEHSSKGACLACAPSELRVREFPGGTT